MVRMSLMAIYANMIPQFISIVTPTIVTMRYVMIPTPISLKSDLIKAINIIMITDNTASERHASNT